MFAFKQFTIHQDRCAMKVGTDGVLLGAWAHVEHCKCILDVGTGTGLVALMAAQRSDAYVVGIDLDADSVEQAIENVEASPWKERIRIVEADMRMLADDAPVDVKLEEQSVGNNSLLSFDAILCNPPYFENSLKCPDAARTMARHTDTLTFDELARSAARILAPEGELSVVIPYDRATDMTVSAACYGLFITRQTIVSHVEGGKPKRVLMAFSKRGSSYSPVTLYIQDAQRNYTPDYMSLVKDFYLRM